MRYEVKTDGKTVTATDREEVALAAYSTESNAQIDKDEGTFSRLVQFIDNEEGYTLSIDVTLEKHDAKQNRKLH